MEKVYLQLYSLGHELNDLPKALEKVAAIGYAGVEFADNYGGFTGAELKKKLAGYGLEGLSAHVGCDKLPEQVEMLAEVGVRYVVDPFGRFNNGEETLRMAEKLNKAGEICQQHGMLFGYHNHTQEFNPLLESDPHADASCAYLLDLLIARTDPALCMFQLDVGWAAAAGVDPVAYIQKHAGRIRLIHAKEAGKVLGVKPPVDFSKMTFDSEGRPIFTDEMKRAFKEVQETNVATGQGIVDWAAVKRAADAQGAEAYIVEREWDYLNDIYACVQADYTYLKEI